MLQNRSERSCIKDKTTPQAKSLRYKNHVEGIQLSGQSINTDIRLSIAVLDFPKRQPVQWVPVVININRCIVSKRYTFVLTEGGSHIQRQAQFQQLGLVIANRGLGYPLLPTIQLQCC